VEKHGDGFIPVTKQRFKTPTPDNLFVVNEDCDKLSEVASADFHTIVAKTLVRPTSRHVSFGGKDSRQSYKTPQVRLSHKILIGNKKGEKRRLRHQEPTPTAFPKTAINRT
jgi:hypothetical protein